DSVTDLHPQVPQGADQGGELALHGCVRRFLQQYQYVYVRGREKLPATIPADCDHRGLGGHAAGGPERSELTVDQFGTALQQVRRVRVFFIRGAQGRHALGNPLPGSGDVGRQGAGCGVVHSARPPGVPQAKRSATSAGGGGHLSDRVSTSTPVSVTTTVCSHCAERLRSLVTMVQPSGSSE